MQIVHKVLCAVSILSISFGIAAAQHADSVGEYGDPQRLEIEGTETFPSATIGDALSGNFDVLMAAHPSAPLEEYLETLREKTATGYRRAGFPDVQVHVRRNQDTIRSVVSVEEGPRYLAAEVRFTGLRTIDREQLIRWLTEPCPPDDAVAEAFVQAGGTMAVRWVDKDGTNVNLEDPIWQLGRPAPFDEPARSRMQAKIKRAFADLGHSFVKFDVAVIGEFDEHAAHLVVNVVDEGPKAVAGKIEIVGNSRNSQEDILRYLKLKPGAPLTVEECTRLKRRLWKSARFLKADVTPSEPSHADDQVTLTIEVEEFEQAPPLSEKLSPEEQITLKLRDWLANPTRWQSDMVICGGPLGKGFQLVFSPDRGALLLVGRPGEGNSRPPFDLAVVTSSGTIGAYAPSAQKRLTDVPTQVKARGNMAFRVSDDPDNAFNILFGFGVTTCGDDESSQPFVLDMTLEPSAFLSVAHPRDGQCTLRDGVLTVLEPKRSRWKIDAESGRLLEFVLPPDEDDPTALRVSFEQGAFLRRCKEVEAASAGCENVFDPKRPLSTLLVFFCEEQLLDVFLDLKPEAARSLRLIRGMLEKGVLEPLDRLVSEYDNDEEEEFEIPQDTRGLGDLLKTNPLAIFVRIGLPACNKLFPYNSWPWTLGRETAFVALKKGEYTGAELQKLYLSAENGPVCCLATASLLEFVDSNLAQLFARKGLKSLSPAGFRKDARVLLSREGAVGKCIVRFAGILRELDEAEVKLLDEAIFQGEDELLVEWARVLRQRPGEPIENVLPEVLDDIWKGGLREHVESALQRLQQRTDQEGDAVTWLYQR